MAFNRVPCPGMYIRHKSTNPKLFVSYCEGFIKTNYHGRKAIGVHTDESGAVMILTMPDYDAKRVIVSGTGKNKTIKTIPLFSKPIEHYLDEDDIAYLQKRGKDKYGNTINRSQK